MIITTKEDREAARACIAAKFGGWDTEIARAWVQTGEIPTANHPAIELAEMHARGRAAYRASVVPEFAEAVVRVQLVTRVAILSRECLVSHAAQFMGGIVAGVEIAMNEAMRDVLYELTHGPTVPR